jgi:hypothetical protein
MNRKPSYLVSVLMIVVVVAAIWIGRGWLWHKLLAMHGIH